MALTDKLTAIADAIRGKTGDTGALTLAQMPAAIEGIETGGGGGKTASGTVTVTNDNVPLFVELDFVPSAIAIWIDDYANKATDGVSKSVLGCFYKGMGFVARTNSAGTSIGGVTYTTELLTDIAENGTTLYSPYVPRPVKTGGFQVYSNYKFKAGYTYHWEAME